LSHFILNFESILPSKFSIDIVIFYYDCNIFSVTGEAWVRITCRFCILGIQWIWTGAPSGVCIWSHCAIWWWFPRITYTRKILWLQTTTSNYCYRESDVLGLQIRCVCTEEGLLCESHNRYDFWPW